MKKNALEWTVFTFGIVAITTMTVGLIHEASVPTAPPDLRLGVERARRVGDQWLVPVTVRNVGGTAAQAVAIRAEAEGQSAEFDLEYVPRASERSGHLVFQEKPEGLKVKASGMATP